MINRDKVRSLANRAGFSTTYELDRLSNLVELVLEEMDEVLTHAQLDYKYEFSELAMDIRKRLKNHFSVQ